MNKVNTFLENYEQNEKMENFEFSRQKLIWKLDIFGAKIQTQKSSCENSKNYWKTFLFSILLSLAVVFFERPILGAKIQIDLQVKSWRLTWSFDVFCRWNAIKREKAKFSKQYPYLVPRSYANLQEKSPKEFFKNSGGNKVKCQVLRSGSNWSIGSNRVEKSIYEATLETIQKAEHYIYIENQFFITNSDSKESLPGQFEEIKNKIGAALVQKVVEAHR